MQNIKTRSFTGLSAKPFITDLARLRISVFREYPYLYEGSTDYEENYLQTFFNAPDSLIVIAFDGNDVVGASTALPLEYETENIQKPWKEQGYDTTRIFYFGESVLLPAYRGRGIGVRFFEHREQWVKKLGGFDKMAFCGVIRPEGHPEKPNDYVPLDRFWRNRGFTKTKDLICYISWQDLGEKQKTPKPLHFWCKDLSATHPLLPTPQPL